MNQVKLYIRIEIVSNLPHFPLWQKSAIPSLYQQL